MKNKTKERRELLQNWHKGQEKKNRAIINFFNQYQTPWFVDCSGLKAKDWGLEDCNHKTIIWKGLTQKQAEFIVHAVNRVKQYKVKIIDDKK